MGIVNTRNAVVGWAVVETGKYAIKHKAKEASKPRMGAWAAGTLAAAALVTYKARRKRRRNAAAEPE